MTFKIQITDSKGVKIELDQFNGLPEGAIKKVKIMSDTSEENPKSRSSNILKKVEIKGEINDDTITQCKRLMDWALLNNSPDVLRTVKIDIKASNGNDLRTVCITQMFVDDYIEEYTEENNSEGFKESIGTFTLKLIQDKASGGKFENGTDIIDND